jgi:4'-phosphopantetheinyl transferase
MRSPSAALSHRPAPRLAPGEVHVWSVALDRHDADDPVLAATLAPEETVRAARLRFARDRRRFVIAHAATRAILGAYLGAAPQAVAIAADRRGKPRLDPARHPRAPRFNLAHSEDLALVAVSAREVGVDVEAERRSLDAEALVRRYFSPAENESYFTLPPEARRAAFVAAWTAKEAYLKGCGDGLARGLASFSVSLCPAGPARLLAVPGRRGHASRWRLVRLRCHPGYVGALAVAGPITALRERTWLDVPR